MYNFTGESLYRAYTGVIYQDFGLLCVYKEFVDSVRMFNIHFILVLVTQVINLIYNIDCNNYNIRWLQHNLSVKHQCDRFMSNNMNEMHSILIIMLKIILLYGFEFESRYN